MGNVFRYREEEQEPNVNVMQDGQDLIVPLPPAIMVTSSSYCPPSTNPLLNCQKTGAGCSGHGYCSPDLDPPRCICDGPTILPAIQPPSPAVSTDYGWGGPACSIGFLPACSATNCTVNGGTCGEIETGYQCLRSSCPAGWGGWDCSERKLKLKLIHLIFF